MHVRRFVVTAVAAPLLVALAVVGGVSSARAAGPPDISGTWSCCGAGGAGAQTWTITDSAGRLSGTGSGGGFTFPISGSIADSNARVVTGPYVQLPSYSATFTGAVSPGNTVISGTWLSNAGQSGTFTATRVGAAPAAPATGPSTITSSLPTPSEAFGSAGAVAASAVVALAAVLFLTFPAHLFNLTFEENYGVISAWWTRQRRRIPGLARRHRTPATTPSSSAAWIGISVLVLLASLLGALLDPHFGSVGTSVDTYVAMVLNTVIGVSIGGSLSVWYHRRRLGQATWRPHALPLGLVVAAMCVLVSRLAGFQPGYLYGVVAGIAIDQALNRRDAGRLAALSVITVMVVSLAAWLLLVPVRGPAGNANAFPVLVVVDDVLGSLLVGGLVGSVLGLIPLRFLPGATIIAWNRTVWAALFAVAMFLMVDLVIRSPASSAQHSGLVMTVVLFVLFASLSLGFREYFAVRWRREHPSDAVGWRARVAELLTPRGGAAPAPPPEAAESEARTTAEA